MAVLGFINPLRVMPVLSQAVMAVANHETKTAMTTGSADGDAEMMPVKPSVRANNKSGSKPTRILKRTILRRTIPKAERHDSDSEDLEAYERGSDESGASESESRDDGSGSGSDSDREKVESTADSMDDDSQDSDYEDADTTKGESAHGNQLPPLLDAANPVVRHAALLLTSCLGVALPLDPNRGGYLDWLFATLMENDRVYLPSPMSVTGSEAGGVGAVGKNWPPPLGNPRYRHLSAESAQESNARIDVIHPCVIDILMQLLARFRNMRSVVGTY